MNQIVENALKKWGLEEAAYRLVAARENAVYEVSDGQNRFALRLHRQGYRSDAELRSELMWMAAAADAGISVPSPVSAQDGKVLHHFDGTQVDVLTWLAGETLAGALGKLDATDQSKLIFRLGREMARLHRASDVWTKPRGFNRAHWNAEGLLGEEPLWDRFWENPCLSREDSDLFKAFRLEASNRLTTVGGDLDYGLIHADLVPANVLIDGSTLHLIDFDDGGFGYRLFDVTTALLKHMSAPDYPGLQSSLIAGYQSIRPLDVAELDLFLALRAATYVGWNVSRMDEPDGTERNIRFIRTLRDLASRYLRSGHSA